MRTRILIIFLILLLCAAAVLAFFYRGSFLPPTATPPVHVSARQAYEDLASSNTAFKQGMDALQDGNSQEAAAKFQQALESTKEPAMQATAKLYLASALTNTGDYERAVGLYKNVGADDRYYSERFRAEAIQELGLMYYRFLDPRITAAIFSDAPYKSLYTEGKIGLSYRRLFEYAASIYPLAISELRAAHWYANQLLDPSDVLKANAARQKRYKETIRSDMSAADTDIAYLATDNTRVSTYFNALLLRANLIGKMARLGDTTYGDPEAEFKRLLALYAANSAFTAAGNLPRLYYAGYLAQTSGTSRARDIESILAPLPSATGASDELKRFLTVNNRDESGIKTMLISIASAYPDFKKLLMSYGWTDADFK